MNIKCIKRLAVSLGDKRFYDSVNIKLTNEEKRAAARSIARTSIVTGGLPYYKEIENPNGPNY